MEDLESIGAQYPKPRGRRVFHFIHHLFILLIVGGLASFLPPSRYWPTVWFFISLGYVAFILLRTRDAVRDYALLLPGEQALIRFSGLLAFLPLAVFLALAYSLEAAGKDVDRLIFGAETGWTLFGALMELGLILSVACICTRRESHIRPALMWKVLAVLLAFAYSAYIFGGLTRGCGTA